MEESVIFRVPVQHADLTRRFARGDTDVDISVEPGPDSDTFTVRLAEGTVSHLLYGKFLQLPTCLELHKTLNYTQFIKAGMVSRVFCVYEATGAPALSSDAASTEDVAMNLNASVGDSTGTFDVVADPTPGTSESVLDSGVSPPMQHAVRRRFRRAHRFISKYSPQLVAEAERVLLDLMTHETYEHVVEDLVDAEEYMAPWFSGGGDNVTIRYVDGKVGACQ
jgi:TATA-binding protein-associated factor Taf7